MPVLGVLHCDVDSSSSPYAPVTSADLRDSHTHAWLLGHIHKPGDLTGVRPVGYLGSLMGLDPSETGRHGPWICRVSGSRVALEQFPLAPLRWERVEVRVEDIREAEELGVFLTEAVRSLHARLRDELGETRLVGCRIVLVGRSPFHLDLRRVRERLDLEDLCPEHDGVSYFVEKVEDASLPARDLDAMAREADPPGLLARKILLLRGEASDPERVRLVVDARSELQRVRDAPVFGLLGDTRLNDEEVAQLLERASLRALEELLAQKEERT